MAVTLNKANLVLKDANGNIGKIEQLSDRDLAKIKTAVSDVALVVNQSNHTPIEATTTNKGVVQLATPADVVSGASDKVVTAEQLHNSTTGTSALATENLARIDAVVTEAGIPIDHTNTNQLKTAVTTLVNNAVPSTATSTALGVVKPDNDTITIDSNGVLTATAQMPGIATTSTVGVVKPDNDTITIDSNGVLTATAQMPGVATTTNVGVVKPDGNTITVDNNGTLTATAQMPGVATNATVGVVKPDNDTITVGADGTLTATAQMPGVATTSSVGVVQPDGRTITITADGVISAIGSGGGSGGGIGFPDFSAKIEISNQYNWYTAPVDGWCFAIVHAKNSDINVYVSDGNKNYNISYWENKNSNITTGTIFFPLRKGQEISASEEYGVKGISFRGFYPCL